MNKKTSFFLANALQVAFRFLQMIVVTRNLSGTDLGLYYVSAAYPQLLARIFDLGLPHAARYYMLKFPNQVYFLTKYIALFSLAIFPFIACLFLFIDLLPLESGEMSAEISRNWLVLSAYCLLLLVNSIFNALIISLEKFRTLLLTFSLPYIVFILVILLRASAGLEASEVVLQLLVSEVIVFAIGVVAMMRFIREAGTGHKRVFGWRQLLLYAFKIYPNGFLKAMATRLDRVVLSFIASPVFIGQYSVLVTVRDIALVPVATYGQLFMNELSTRIRTAKRTVGRFLGVNLLWIFLIYSAGFLIYLPIQEFVLEFFFKESSNPELYTMGLVLALSAVPHVLLAFIHYFFLSVNGPQHISVSSLLAMISFYGFVALTYGYLGSSSFYFAAFVSPLVGLAYLLAYSTRIVRKLNDPGA
jgi:O-antigen/teichoic acid export membrane protein